MPEREGPDQRFRALLDGLEGARRAPYVLGRDEEFAPGALFGELSVKRGLTSRGFMPFTDGVQLLQGDPDISGPGNDGLMLLLDRGDGGVDLRKLRRSFLLGKAESRPG